MSLAFTSSMFLQYQAKKAMKSVLPAIVNTTSSDPIAVSCSATQLDAPAPEYLPTSQSEQIEAVGSEKVPASQSSQALAPASEAVPAAHDSQAGAPSDEYLPESHAKHKAELALA